MSVLTMVELIWAEFWERFPGLHFSLTEGDTGWIPYFLWRAEHVHDRHSGWTGQVFPEGGGPVQNFHDHVLCCFINDPIGVELLDHFNVDHVCWESDFPHSDGTWPNAPEKAAALLSGLPDEVVRKVTHENAMRHYQFDPFASRPREMCTAAALRAEAGEVDTVTRVGRPADERDLEAWRRITSRAAASR